MTSYFLRRLTSVMLMPIALGIFLTGCSPQPANTNTATVSNQNASPNAAPAAKPGVNNAPFGWLDSVQGEAKTGNSLTLAGWAVDHEDGVPVTKIEVLLDDKVLSEATLGKERMDVAKSMGKPAWQNSGWVATVWLANVSSGAHKIAVVAYDSAGAKGTLNGARDIQVAAK